MSVRDIRSETKGRWPSLLTSMGVESKFLTGRHLGCPMCGGRDRFRFDNKDGAGTWFCNGCGAGDGVKLIMEVMGWSFLEAVGEIRKHLGTSQVGQQRAAKAPEEVKEAMNALWRASVPYGELLAVRGWLEGRGVYRDGLKSIRAARSVRMGRDTHCVMLARVMDAGGKPVNIHRTFLTIHGEKPDLPSQRMVMPIELPDGCAVRLMEHEHVLGVAEGIETAISASILHNVPTWATLNSGRLKAWTPPEGVSEVVIFGDNDANYAGQAAAFSLANKLSLRGLSVRVEIPQDRGHDWNDVLLGQRPHKNDDERAKSQACTLPR